MATSLALAQQNKPVRLSFLAHGPALRNTLELLRTNGCSDQAIASFQTAAEHYFSTGFDLDLSQFPKPRDGFYHFATISDAAAALPDRLTAHDYTVNCFDTAILLAGDFMQSEFRLDDTSRTFIISSGTNEQCLVTAKSAREAFAEQYHASYRQTTDHLFSGALVEKRALLTPSLFRWHNLPKSTTPESLQRDVLNTLRTNWNIQHLQFPQNMEIMLFHDVNFSNRLFYTSHVGVLMRRPNGHTYLEKSGGRGPFVRLDVAKRADLIPWFASKDHGAGPKYTAFFVTYSDTQIEKLERPK